MRQAGRYQPEYRAIKEQNTLAQIVEQPELCAQVTLLPVEQLGVDAAILFSDITTPMNAMGVDFEIRDGIGPCLEDPIRTAADIGRLSQPRFEHALPHVGETIGLLRERLEVPLIGFCGAPYTLASYLVEGGPSKHYAHVKGLMHSDATTWHRLMEMLSVSMAEYLKYQAASGAQALQIFDSWVGTLGKDDYCTYVAPHMQVLVDEVRQGTDVPLIHFGTNTGHLLAEISQTGYDVIGVDWRISLTEARQRIPESIAIQGNLDPSLLLAPWEQLEASARRILDEAPQAGFIFNLGHGVLPSTPVRNLQRLTELVHAFQIEK
jgi:uroporphyrinogen decarboxylase